VVAWLQFVEQVLSQWKEERELYTADYKKRRRDALRKKNSRSHRAR